MMQRLLRQNATKLRIILLGETSVVFGGFIVQLVLTFVTGIMIARLLGPEGYGVLNILRGIFMTIATFSSLGLEVALLRFCGVMPANDPNTFKLLLRLRLLTAAVNFAIVAIAMLVEVLFLSHVYEYDNFTTLYFMTLVMLPMQSDMAVISGIYRAYSGAKIYSVLTMYLQSVFRIVAIGILFFASGGIKMVVVINGLQIALAWLALHIHTHRPTSSMPRPEAGKTFFQVSKEVFFGSWRDTRPVLKLSLWMTVSAFVIGVMRSSDTLILGAYATASDVGAYAALSTVAQLVQMFPFAASQSLGPKVAKLYHDGDLQGVHDAFNEYIRRALLVSSFIFAGIAVFGPDLNLIFGENFKFEPLVCFLLPLGYVFSSALAPTGYALSMTGRHRAEFVILVSGCIGLVALFFWLIPLYGQVGAASALVIGTAATNVVRFIYVSRVMGFVPGRVRDILPAFLALAVAYLCKTVELKLTPVSFWATAAACIAYAAIFAPIGYLCWSFRESPARPALKPGVAENAN
jgi:O-antigen/teichoic acid export membrane protein